MDPTTSRSAPSSAKQALLDLLLAEEAGPPLSPEIPLRRSPELVLAPAQERLWFLAQLAPDNPFYNIPTALRLRGPLHIPALQAGLAAILRRHEALRTCIPAVDGQPMPRLAAPGLLPLPIHDLTHLPAPAREAAAEQAARAEAARPFELAADLPVRTALVRLDPQHHIFLLTLHHIAADGWSVDVFLRELAAGYTTALQGRPVDLGALPIQYSDYAAWHRTVLAGPSLDDSLAYWAAHLAGPRATLDLPTARPRPPVQSYRGAVETQVLPPALAAAVRDLARREQVTPFMTTLAAFQTLVLRYTGQTDLILGTPSANRSHPALVGLIGFFTNTLLLRTDLEGNPTFHELLGRVRAVAQEAYSHADVPFDKLVDICRPERDLSRNPLCNLLFAWQDRVQLPHFAGLAVEPLRTDSSTAQFDSTWTVEDDPAGLRVSVQYATDIFDGPTVRQMLGHYARVLEAAVAAPDTHLADLPLLAPSEYRQVVQDWNTTQVAPLWTGTLPELFAAQVARTPDAPAVLFEDEVLSYSELDARATQLAHYLRARGVGPEVLVALCAERSPHLVVGLLGILKAGGAYVPLDPDYPAERLAFMLADSQAALLLTQAGLRDRLPTATPPVVYLDSDWPQIAAPPAPAPLAPPAPDHLAYMIYTSGSTGQPKGALNTHRGIVNRLWWMQDAYQLTAADRVLQKTPFSFDVSVWEFFWPLLTGAGLVLARPQGHRDPAYLSAVIERAGVTTLHFVPSMLRVFLDSGDPRACRAVRQVICSGEALSFELQERFFARLPGVALYNLYGPTEAAVDVSAWACRPGDPAGIVPIGTPIANIQLYVLDAHLAPVPVGVPGQLYIAGVGLGRGYHHRPALTAARFIPNPFSATPGARMYATGDLTRWRPDGSIEYLGRTDDQVKVRGFRIELGEIAATLERHPAVRQAVVVARPGVAGEPHLVAYLVTADGAALPGDILRAWLGAQVPDHLVPAAFVCLAALPLNASGKVDRKALPDPGPARPELTSTFVAPRTPAEATLATIWQDVLGLAQVGIDDNYFALGGDSLRSIQVLARAQAAGLSLALPQLFQQQTIRSLAATLAPGAAVPAPAARAPFNLISAADREILPADVEDAYPLTLLQSGMFFHSDLDQAAAMYHDIAGYRLRAPFVLPALRLTLQAVIDRHPVLRTSFDFTHYSEPLQLVHRTANSPLAVADLQDQDPAAQAARVQDWIATEKHQPFDPQQAPLFRVQIHRCSAQEFQLHLSFHHAILDGWSLASLVSELLDSYMARLQNPTAALPAPPRSAFDAFVALERAALADEAESQFWAATLATLEPTMLPDAVRPVADEPSDQVRVVHVLVPRAIAARLQHLAAQAEVPIKSVLLAAHLRVLQVATGQETVVTGLVSNGRPEQAGGDAVLGLFLNTLPLRHRLDGGRWHDLVAATFAAEQALLPHRRYPLARLQQQAGGRPLFDTAFNFTHFHVYKQLDAVAGLNIIERTFFEQTNYALVAHFGLSVGAGAVELQLHGNARLIGAAALEALAGYYATALAQMAAAPEVAYGQQTLLPAPEVTRLLHAWNPPPAPPAPAATLLDRFAAQVALRPDAVAVTCGPVTLTYAALDRQATALAHRLVAQGVGPGVPVAFFLDRSAALPVAILAILKAGGAYVPLDPAYPAERLAFMLADCRPPVLISEPVLHERLPAYPGRVLLLDPTELAASPPAPAPLSPRATAADLAYIIYTSGSTGQPKGNLLTHQHVLRLFTSTAPWFGFAPDDVWSLFHSTAFDFSVWELWGALLYGGRLVVVPYWVSRDPAAFHALLARERVTVLNQTPAAFRQLIAADAAPGAAPLALRLVIFGGEALDLPALAPWMARHGMTRPQLVNMYGITETTVHVTYRPLTAADVASATPSLIGGPIPDLRLYLLDPHGQPVPVGVSGEIYVGGPGVAWGYLNRPDLTATRFVPDPFGAEPGARLYRSGDLARRRADGDLEYLGRADSQVKLRGFRIELGEIETALEAQPGVTASAVLLREDRPGAPRLVAYLVGPAARRPTAATLRQALAARLPDYMVPAAYTWLTALPLTAHGKLDRRALPAPSEDSALAGTPYEAPRTATEAALADLWTGVLGVPQVGIHDNFFELGGHSLTASRLVQQIRGRWAGGLPLRALFEHPTVAALAALLDATGPTPAPSTGTGQVRVAAPAAPALMQFEGGRL